MMFLISFHLELMNTKYSLLLIRRKLYKTPSLINAAPPLPPTITSFALMWNLISVPVVIFFKKYERHLLTPLLSHTIACFKS